MLNKMVLLVLMSIFCLLIQTTYSQHDHNSSEHIVEIILTKPTELMLENLWNMTLEHISGKNIKVCVLLLKAFVKEENDGLIIEATSEVFELPKGQHSYGYDTFKSGKISFKNMHYEQILARTSEFPEGKYTICVSAYEESGKLVGKETCITVLQEN